MLKWRCRDVSSVLLSINLWIYSIDFLQFLISNPSPNLIVLHLSLVLQFIHMKKALLNHLPCNSSGVQPWGKSLSSYQNIQMPSPTVVWLNVHAKVAHACTGQTHICGPEHVCGPGTALRACLLGLSHMYPPHPPSALFDQAFKQLLVACMNRLTFWSWNKRGGVKPLEQLSCSYQWGMGQQLDSARPDWSCSLV